MNIPNNLTHKPIIGVDYSEIDGNAGDAKYLSIGKSTWNKEDLSAKVFRSSNNQWSRQSEELPLWRVLDLAVLLVGTITGQHTNLDEQIVKPQDKDFVDSFISDNMELYNPRILELRRLLANKAQCRQDDSSPNIFSFATSELSQDAILSWLLSYADDRYKLSDPGMCALGKSFVSLLTAIPTVDIHSVSVGRQWEHIDIWAEINDDAILIIEDKTGTSEHDKQLERYMEIVKQEYNDSRPNQFFTYIKTENEPESITKNIEAKGYRVFSRQDLLGILAQYDGNNTILNDYRLWLSKLEDACAQYKNNPVKNWDWYAWQGFYSELEKHIDVESWGYVSNPSGGFLGLWWNFKSNEEVRMYLQFEQDKLCVKMETKGGGNRSDIRDKYHQLMMTSAKKLGVTIERPARFGAGTYMTIGIVPGRDIFGDGIIDFKTLVPKLKGLEAVVEDAINNA